MMDVSNGVHDKHAAVTDASGEDVVVAEEDSGIEPGAEPAAGGNRVPNGNSRAKFIADEAGFNWHRENPDVGVQYHGEEIEEDSGNREPPEDLEEEVSAHNRSHDSLESRRTIIEADDFASFLAREDEEDEDYMNDFRDEDIDFDAAGGDEEGGVDLSFLLTGSNPYMLDFTSGMLGDSEVEDGEEEEEEDDGTLSHSGGSREERTPRDQHGGGGRGTPSGLSRVVGTENGGLDDVTARTPRRSKKSRSVRKTESWLRHSSSFQHRRVDGEEHGGGTGAQEDEDDEDEELESPPRNLREEINNNVAKMHFAAGVGFAGVSNLYPPADERSDYHPAATPMRSSGLPGLSKYFIRDSNTDVPVSFSLQQENHHHHHQFQQTSSSQPALPSKTSNSHHHHHPQHHPHHRQHHYSYEHQQVRGDDAQDYEPPQSQSSPKLSRTFDGSSRAGGSLLLPRHGTEDHSSNQLGTSSSSSFPSTHHQLLPARLESYALETPLGSRARSFSASLDNLYRADPAATFTSDPGGHVGGGDGAEWVTSANRMSRRNSLPNIPAAVLNASGSGIPAEARQVFQRGVDATAGMCQNCGFSRNDYLFKIGLLQTQLEKTEKELKRKEKQWAGDLGELRKDNERQQKVISQSLSLGPEARIEATMQHEITRLTSENLDLRESIDKQTDQIRKLKKLLKVYAKKLKDGEAAEIAAELEGEENAAASGDAIATVIHRERSYMGMLEYKKEDEGALIKNLILDLKPKISTGHIPGLPAYILFMCVRHTDYVNDDEKVKSLLTSTINGIKKVVKRHSDDLERITMWLANTCRLLHTLKQYSGEKQFQAENTSKQTEQSLRNFDLSEYRQVFSDLAVWNYQALMKLMEELIQNSIVPAILEHEAIAGLTASKPSGLRGRASSNAKEMEDGKDSQISLDALMRVLNSYMRIVKQHAVDPELVKQIFRQLFYYLCAGALNNLLLRKDMCNWSKGMQIRYNLSHLEQWLRDNSLHEFGAQAALEPIIQASQLLQARKTDSDVESICDMCSKLTTAQIVKILNIYTPVDEFEERVPIAFIRKIQARLKTRDSQQVSSTAGTASSTTLLLDTKYSYPVTFPFNPSSVALETISVPDQLHLGFLVRH